MYEENQNTEVDVNDLQIQLTNARADFDRMRETSDRMVRYNERLVAKIDRLKAYFENVWDEDTDSDVAQHFTEIAEIFDISTTVNKEISFTITGTATISVERGNVSNIEHDDFLEVSISSFMGAYEVDDYTFETIEVSVN